MAPKKTAKAKTVKKTAVKKPAVKPVVTTPVIDIGKVVKPTASLSGHAKQVTPPSAPVNTDFLREHNAELRNDLAQTKVRMNNVIEESGRHFRSAHRAIQLTLEANRAYGGIIILVGATLTILGIMFVAHANKDLRRLNS